MRRTTIAMISAVLLTWLSSTMSAHHSFAAQFDATKPIRITGRVTKVAWVNPHVWVYITHDSGDDAQDWAIEGGAPNALIRRGLRPEALPPGSSIVVEGYRAKSGNVINGRVLFLDDSRKITLE